MTLTQGLATMAHRPDPAHEDFFTEPAKLQDTANYKECFGMLGGAIAIAMQSVLSWAGACWCLCLSPGCCPAQGTSECVRSCSGSSSRDWYRSASRFLTSPVNGAEWLKDARLAAPWPAWSVLHFAPGWSVTCCWPCPSPCCYSR